MRTTIIESEGNQNALIEPMVGAVSSAIAFNPKLVAKGLAWIEAFDELPLLQILETMRGLDLFREESLPRYFSDVVHNKLHRILFPPTPKPVKAPSKRERRAADKQAAAAARLAETERNLELGRKLAALRAATPSNKIFGRTVREQFDIYDPLRVAAVMRVARRYGDRPEVYRQAKLWRVLVKLSASTLPESRRQVFERRILAGENVKAAEIV